jgi:hypothetical protein
LKAAAAAAAEKKASLPKKKKEDDTNKESAGGDKEEAGGDKKGANDANETTTTTTSTTIPTTTTTTTTAAAADAPPVPPEEEEDEDGKASATASTATTSSPPPRTYVENLTCCVCMDDLQVDTNTFGRLACCGQAMDEECWAKFQNSTMPQAQKDVCPQCRQKIPTSKEEAVEQIRVWVDKGKAWAQTNLANKYHFGDGVPQSYEKAIDYLNMAVKQCDPNGMCDLAIMYR